MLFTRKVKNLEQGTKSPVFCGEMQVPVKDTTDATAFIREHLHPTFTGSKFTRHGTEQEPLVKEQVRSLGNAIVDTGMYVSNEKHWL